MNMDKKEGRNLLNKYLEGRCTPEERVQVEQWYAGLTAESDWHMESARREEAQLAMKQRIDRQLGLAPSRPVWQRSWIRYAAAVLLLAGAATVFFLRTSKTPAPAPVAEILPGGNKAILTLGNGKTIALDQAAAENIAQQGNSRISKLAGGQLIYQSQGNAVTTEYNTLSTPRGGQYRLVLPDGSKVWLNALSSVRFPAAFTGKERNVTITGEVYFDIAANATQPFQVSIANNPTRIAVLGTQFNISAYPDEPLIKTTLLQGKVKVSSEAAVILQPGQQAVLANTPGQQPVSLLKEVDTEAAIAWMNGYFQFQQADVKTVMQQIARWYDVNISYEGKIPDRRFSGEISRSANLSEVLKGLSVSGINFRREGRNIIILP
ncbi:FecR family protein [Chitinophaga arvensicola]|uniref:FecR protein n=1 Tax=Chitinophaga arvensicola TaxID=29529 RepID=A0A1I0SB06_9BACT|nr:FecR family protein [Chitinophaga arvensicola]SEW53841.1 FecR protein [Chitinophaga arvensicola]